MAAGATYHAALASELQALGFAIDRVGKNGIFEVAEIEESVIRYFSARRNEIEEELANHGVTSAGATALASAIAKATRSIKEREAHRREETWAEAAGANGFQINRSMERLRDVERTFNHRSAETLLAERLSALPTALTEHDSVIDRRELVRSVAEALVGTGLPVERADIEVARLLSRGAIVEIGHDVLGLPRYSTLEMMAIEREIVVAAQDLAQRTWRSIDSETMIARCEAAALNAEQTTAAIAATDASAVAIIEGAPGTGKTTTLAPIVKAYQDLGCRVLGTATAWRVAGALRDDLGIDARATASWIEALNRGQPVFDARTVLIADEVGLLSSRDMHDLLGAVAQGGAKVVLVGDRRQLQPIGPGPGLDLVARAVEAARVETIVRQREEWARDAVQAFGTGRANVALQVFADHGLLIEAEGAKAAVTALVDAWETVREAGPDQSVLLIARTNAQVAGISEEVRNRLKAAGVIRGAEVAIEAATPSGQPTTIFIAGGDQIRFLTRNDDLGVVNGTTATVVRVKERSDRSAPTGRCIRIEASVEGRLIAFDPQILANDQGRARIGWAYASTVYGCQGLTVERAFVALDPSFDRYGIHVAASRACGPTTLVIDSRAVDRRLATELPIDQRRSELMFSAIERREWLAQRLARGNAKISTIEVIEATRSDQQRQATKSRDRERAYEL